MDACIWGKLRDLGIRKVESTCFLSPSLPFLLPFSRYNMVQCHCSALCQNQYAFRTLSTIAFHCLFCPRESGLGDFLTSGVLSRNAVLLMWRPNGSWGQGKHRDGLQPRSDGLQPNSIENHSTSTLMSWQNGHSQDLIPNKDLACRGWWNHKIHRPWAAMLRGPVCRPKLGHWSLKCVQSLDLWLPSLSLTWIYCNPCHTEPLGRNCSVCPQSRCCLLSHCLNVSELQALTTLK